jgi:hypothetical protein
MLDHIERVMHPERVPTRKETPTFSEWFRGRFWKEWVVGRMNKPTEVRSKNIIFECHLEPRFGKMPLDEVTTSEVAQFRADRGEGAEQEAHQQHPRGAVEADDTQANPGAAMSYRLWSLVIGAGCVPQTPPQPIEPAT